MKVLTIESRREMEMWRQRCAELRRHDSTRRNYFPFHMDKWEAEQRRILKEFNLKICELNKERTEREREQERMRFEDESERKRLLEERRNSTNEKRRLRREEVKKNLPSLRKSRRLIQRC